MATGDPACAKMCLASISSLRDWEYADYIFIITDLTDIPWPRHKTIVHQVAAHPSAFSSRYWKTQAGLLSPFNKNIYLDCDILAASHLKDIWHEVKTDGIGLTVDHYPTLHPALVNEYRRLQDGDNGRTFSLAEHRSTAEIAAMDCPYYNGGVVCWGNNAESVQFFSHWHDEWKRFSGRDQFALARALKSSGVTVYGLSEAYNFFAPPGFTLAKAINRKVTFVHFWGENNKKAFFSFSKQIRAFKAFDALTQEKLRDAFKATIFRDRHIIKLLPLIFLFPPPTCFRVLYFIGLSIFSIVRLRTPMK